MGYEGVGVDRSYGGVQTFYDLDAKGRVSGNTTAELGAVYRVARHLDTILSVPEVHAIQWVQGVGDDLPIMQWVPFIKEIQAHGVPVIVDLGKEELDGFMAALDPEGLFLWVATETEEEELDLLKRVETWT